MGGLKPGGWLFGSGCRGLDTPEGVKKSTFAFLGQKKLPVTHEMGQMRTF